MTVSGHFELKVRLGENVLKSLEAALKESSKVPEHLLECLEVKHATVEEILEMQPYVKESNFRLHELLKDCEVILPEPVVEPRSPELEARLVKLRAMAAQQEYRAMTKNVTAPRYNPDDSIAHQIKFMNRQLVAVGQFVFSVAAGFAFGFFGIELLTGRLDFGFRLLLGVICALIVALAEIYFLAKIIVEMEDESKEPSPNPRNKTAKSPPEKSKPKTD